MTDDRRREIIERSSQPKAPAQSPDIGGSAQPKTEPTTGQNRPPMPPSDSD